MVKADLANGVAIYYERGPSGAVRLHYPDGLRVETTWAQLAMIDKLTRTLQEAYELLLKRAAGEGPSPDRELEALVRIDDVLYAAALQRVSGRAGTGAPTCQP